MQQVDTNMDHFSYVAYCNAWVVCFDCDTMEWDRIRYSEAVEAGIVFG